ncbi:MAG: hypothetical protein ACR2RB_00555 [Gammaproteobacteria bacterium]
MIDDPTAHVNVSGMDEPNPVVMQLHRNIAYVRQCSEKRRKMLKKMRRATAGKDPYTQEDEQQIRANLIYSTFMGLMPHLYARAPESQVRPAEAADLNREPWIGGFARTLQVVVNRAVREAGTKVAGKRAVMGTLVGGVGWVKCTYQRDYRRDPHIERRLNDAQDNMARLEHEVAELQNPDQDERELRARRDRLQDLVAALSQQVEVLVQEGLRVEFVAAENMECDPMLECALDYEQGRFMMQRIFMPLEEAESKFQVKLDLARFYTIDGRQETDGHASTPVPVSMTGQVNEAHGNQYLVAVWECWDKTVQTVYTVVEGFPQFARPPFQPSTLGERWYPFFGLAFFPVDGVYWPLNMVELLRELQQEYNDTRTQLAEHREISIAHWMVDAELDEKSVRRFRSAKMGDLTMVNTQGRPIRDVVVPADNPAINPVVYDTGPIRSDIEMVSGLQDAARGAVFNAKTATEAEILQQGLVSRTSEMQDSVEDWINELMKYAAEILLQELVVEDALRLAGPGAVWPTLHKAQIFDLVAIEMRAGSSRRPNRTREQQLWIQLVPQLREQMMIVRQLMATGLDPGPEVELLKETLRRFDERIELEKYIPGITQYLALMQQLNNGGLGVGGGAPAGPLSGPPGQGPQAPSTPIPGPPPLDQAPGSNAFQPGGTGLSRSQVGVNPGRQVQGVGQAV